MLSGLRKFANQRDEMAAYVMTQMPNDDGPDELWAAERARVIQERLAALGPPPVPHATEVAPDDPPSARQRRLLFVLLHDAGFVARAQRNRAVSEILGRQVESSRSLTKFEAAQVIEHFLEAQHLPSKEQR